MYLKNVEKNNIGLLPTDYDAERINSYMGLFRNVSVSILNYCLEGEDSSSLVFANQPTLARGLNSRFRNEDFSECHFAIQQCKADWVNSAKMEHWSYPLVSSSL